MPNNAQNKTLHVHTFAANLRYAIRNRQSVEIGGGTFSGDELRAVLNTIEDKTAGIAIEPSTAVALIDFLSGFEEDNEDGNAKVVRPLLAILRSRLGE